MGILQDAREIMADTIERSADAIRTNHRVRLALLAVLFTIAFCVFITATLFANSSYVPEDDVQEINNERSQVFIGGTGYRVDNYKRKGHDASKDLNTTIIGQNESGYIGSGQDSSLNPGTSTFGQNSGLNNGQSSGLSSTPSTSQSTSPYRRTYPSTGSTYSSSYPRRSYSSYPRRSYSYNRTSPYSSQQSRPSQSTSGNNNSSSGSSKPSSYDKKKTVVKEDPKITIKGVKAKETVEGETKSFTVTAKSYDGDSITGKKLVVKMNGVKLTPVKDNKYEGEVLDGDNKIEVKATDASGNSAKKTVKFKGVRDTEPEAIGKLNVLMSADVLGIKEVSSKKSVDIFEDETLADVVKRYFEDAEVKIVAKDSNYYSIERVKKKGILDDIPEETVAQLEELEIPIPEDKDSLGTDDFGPGSGWVVMVNGKVQDDYMSDLDPDDKSTVEISYVIPDLE